MNIALFGGSFDPVHRGHLAVARAAAERFKLSKVLFVPTNIQPLKSKQQITPFEHRYAMVALACNGEKRFVPSLIEAPDREQPERPNYSIDTVRQLKRTLKKADKLFFLVGIDSFMEIAKWRESEALLHEVEFIVASRPGFSLADIGRALPESMRPQALVTQLFKKQAPSGDLAIGGAMIHLLEDVKEPVSATKIRAAAQRGGNLASYVGEAVAEYIKKEQLYKAKPDVVEPEEPQAKRPQLEVVGGRAHRKKGHAKA